MNLCIIYRSVLIYLLLCYGKKIVNGDETRENRNLSPPAAKSQPISLPISSSSHRFINANFNNSNSNRSVGVGPVNYAPGGAGYPDAYSHRTNHTPANSGAQPGFQSQYPAGYARGQGYGPAASHSRPEIRPVSPQSQESYYAPQPGQDPRQRAAAYVPAGKSYGQPGQQAYNAAGPDFTRREARAAYHQPGPAGYAGSDFEYGRGDPGMGSASPYIDPRPPGPTHQQPRSYQAPRPFTVSRLPPIQLGRQPAAPPPKPAPAFDPELVDLDVRVKRNTQYYTYFRDTDGTEVFVPIAPYVFDRVFEGEFELWQSKNANYPKEIVFIPNENGNPTLEVVFSDSSSDSDQPPPKRKSVPHAQSEDTDARPPPKPSPPPQTGPKPIPSSSSLFTLDIKLKQSNNQVDYRHYPNQKIQKFTCKPGFLIQSVVKQGRVLKTFSGNKYPNRLMIMADENNKPVLRTLCPSDVDELEPEPIPHPKYYPQPTLPPPRQAVVPKPQMQLPKQAVLPKPPAKQVKFITIDVNHRETSPNMVLYQKEGQNVHVFTAFDPYYIKAVERGSETLWEYQQGKYPIQVIYEERGTLNPRLELLYSEDEEVEAPAPPKPAVKPAAKPPAEPAPAKGCRLITLDIKNKQSNDEFFYMSYPKLKIQKFVCKPGFLIKTVTKSGSVLFNFEPGLYPNRLMIMVDSRGKPVLRTLCPTDKDPDEPDPIPDPSHYPQPGVVGKPAVAVKQPLMVAAPPKLQPQIPKFIPQPPKKVAPPKVAPPPAKPQEESEGEEIILDEPEPSAPESAKPSEAESESESESEGELIELEPAPKPAPRAPPKLKVVSEPKIPPAKPEVVTAAKPQAIPVPESEAEHVDSEGELIPMDESEPESEAEKPEPPSEAESVTSDAEVIDVKPPAKPEPEPKPVKVIDYESLTGAEININSTQESHIFTFLKRGRLRLFSARGEYGFSAVKHGGTCCKAEETIWEAKDKTDFAKQIRAFQFYRGPLEVIISQYNGERYKYLKFDKGWAKFNLSKKNPVTLNIRETFCIYSLCSHKKDGIREYTPKEGFFFNKLAVGESGCCSSERVIWETNKEENYLYKVIRDGAGRTSCSANNITLYFLNEKVKHLRKTENDTWIEISPLYELDIGKKNDCVFYSYTEEYGFGVYTARDDVLFTTVKLASSTCRVSAATFWSTAKRPYSKKVITNLHFGRQRTKYVTIELSNGKSIHYISPKHSKNWKMMQILIDLNLKYKKNKYEYQYSSKDQLPSFRTNHNFLFYRVMDKKSQVWKGREGEYASLVIMKLEYKTNPTDIAIILSTGSPLYFKKYGKFWSDSKEFPPFELELDHRFDTSSIEFNEDDRASTYTTKHGIYINGVLKTGQYIWKAQSNEDLAHTVVLTNERLIIRLINSNNLIYDLHTLNMFNFSTTTRRLVNPEDHSVTIEEGDSDKDEDEDEDEDDDDQDGPDDSVSVMSGATFSPTKPTGSETASVVFDSEAEWDEDPIVTVGTNQVPAARQPSRRRPSTVSLGPEPPPSPHRYSKPPKTKKSTRNIVIDEQTDDEIVSVVGRPLSNPGYKTYA